MENKLIDYILNNKEKHYRIAFSYVKNQDDALDIVQDAIVKALKYQHTLKDESAMHTWFCKILINTAKTSWSKNKEMLLLDEETIEKCQQAVCDEYTDFELLEAIEQLSEKEKNIILLRYMQQFSLQEISQITGHKLSTTKSVLYRALNKLKKILEHV